MQDHPGPSRTVQDNPGPDTDLTPDLQNFSPGRSRTVRDVGVTVVLGLVAQFIKKSQQ